MWDHVFVLNEDRIIRAYILDLSSKWLVFYAGPCLEPIYKTFYLVGPEAACEIRLTNIRFYDRGPFQLACVRESANYSPIKAEIYRSLDIIYVRRITSNDDTALNFDETATALQAFYVPVR